MERSSEPQSCRFCGGKTKRIFLPSAISISSEQTRYEGDIIAQADNQCRLDQKKDTDEKREMKKVDEHWKREWHRAELHGANDGGESLKDQMRQALGSETNETEKAVFEKRIA